MTDTVNVLIKGPSNMEIAEQLSFLYGKPVQRQGDDFVIMVGDGAWLAVYGEGWSPMGADSADAMFEWDIIVSGGRLMSSRQLARKVFDDLVASTGWAVGLFPVDHVTDFRPLSA